MGMVAAGVWVARADEWQPAALAALLIVLSFGGEWLTIESIAGVVSPVTAVITLAMGLLGPIPAAVCGIAAIALHSAVARRKLDEWLNNLAAFGVAAFLGGLALRAVSPDVAAAHGQRA